MSMTINELCVKRAKAWNDAKAYLDAHRREDGLLSPEEVAEYEKLEAKIVNFGAEIDRLKKLKDYDAEMSQPIQKPIFMNPGNYAAAKSFTATDEYKCAVLDGFRSGFKNPSNELRVGLDPSGGYLVPDEYDRRLIQGLEEENILRKLGTIITTSGQHKINIAATKPAAAWVEEGETLTFGDATFDQVLLDAYKLHVAIKVTEELLNDNAFGLENFILDSFAKALGNAEEDAFLNGDGNNKPTGIFDPVKGGEIGLTAASTSIKSDEVVDLVYSLKRPYRKNAAFIMNDQTLASLRKLKDSTGQYLWQPGLQAGEPDRILGYPVYTSAYCPVAEAGKPVMAFGDFSYYNIGDRGTRSFAELKELYAANGMVAFVCKERTDGKLVLPEAVKIMKIKA